MIELEWNKYVFTLKNTEQNMFSNFQVFDMCFSCKGMDIEDIKCTLNGFYLNCHRIQLNYTAQIKLPNRDLDF